MVILPEVLKLIDFLLRLEVRLHVRMLDTWLSGGATANFKQRSPAGAFPDRRSAVRVQASTRRRRS